MECWVCLSVAGEKRICPGPAIYEGRYWMVEHAYPAKMKGWLVLVLKRHAEALHELSAEEFAELADVQRRTVALAHAAFGSQKEYVMCLAEGAHFHHIHVHVVAK